MMVDDPTTSGIVEIPTSLTPASLDAELDEYNAKRPMAPYSEEACRAMWAVLWLPHSFLFSLPFLD